VRSSRVFQLPPRERILDAAEALFFHEGVRRVTVEAIAKRAQTTKMAVYRHFESKEALVEEWLRIVTAQYAEALKELERQQPDNPRAQILGFVRFVIEGLEENSYRGCPFINTLAELPEKNDPARKIIEAHKMTQAQRLSSLCQKMGLKEPEVAAAQIIFLLEGAQVSAQNGSIRDIGTILVKTIGDILAAE
jgi:AcrR family transcriptional regulator